jgi:hypothetical protein
MFESSFDASVTSDRRAFAGIEAGDLKILNRDLDTGQPVSPGEYQLTDKTYDQLLRKLAKKNFDGVSAELRTNILAFYAAMKTPDPHGVDVQLAALKALSR